jgi:hypothetical protein
MAHAKASDLADILPLIEKIRTVGALKEKSLGCFYFKSKGVLHFHVQKGRRFAHVFDGQNWQEVDIKSEPSLKIQARFFDVISKLLKNLGM